MFKTSLEKYDYGPSARAEVNMPLITMEAKQRQASDCTKGTILPTGKRSSSKSY